VSRFGQQRQDVSKVDKGREVAISLGEFGRSHCITDYRNLEPQLQEFPQMGLDTCVRKHPRENDLIDALFAELERQIVNLGAI